MAARLSGAVVFPRQTASDVYIIELIKVTDC